MHYNKNGFTLIELIVSIAILSIIMVSVFTIFQLSADLNNKTDISRALQENIKNIVETIAEDVRKNGISGVNSDVILSGCELPEKNTHLFGTKLCVGWNSYYVAKRVWENWNRVTEENECNEQTHCFLVKNNGFAVTQLSNSWVQLNKAWFYVGDNGMKKITLAFELQPSYNKGINSDLIIDHKIIFQTTLSERLYNDY